MRASCGVDQLSGDTDAARGLSDAALEDVAHAEFAADLLHVDRPALVGEARVAGDDEDPLDARQAGDDVFDHAVGEVVLLGVATQVGEGQYCDGRFVRQRQARPSAPGFRSPDAGDGGPIGLRGVADQRPQAPLTGDAFELVQTSIAEIEA